MGQRDPFDRGPNRFKGPTISPLDWKFLAGNDRGDRAEREVGESAGMDVNDGVGSRNPGGGETFG